MSNKLTRRDFMKCAGITVLAVGAAGLLSGCEEGSGAASGGVNQPLTINGITVTVTGYEEGKVTAGIAGITVTDDNHVFFYPEVTIKNNTANTYLVSSATNFTLKVDGEEYPTSATASAAALIYNHPLLDQDTRYGVAAGKTRNGAVAYFIPKDWKKAELKFIPDISKANEFVTFVITHK